MSLMDEIREPGRAFSEVVPTPIARWVTAERPRHSVRQKPRPTVIYDEATDMSLKYAAAAALNRRSVVAMGVAAATSIAHAVREAEAQAMRDLAQYIDEMAGVARVDWNTLASAMVTAANTIEEFGLTYKDAGRPDPRDATSVLAHRAARAASRQAGLDRVGSRKAWVYGPGLRRPPTPVLLGRQPDDLDRHLVEETFFD